MTPVAFGLGDDARGLHHVADHVERETIPARVAIGRDADADGAVGDGGAVQRDAGLGGGRHDAVFLRMLGQLQTQQVQELARGVGPRLIERGGEAADPLIVLAEFLLVGQHVVHAVDQIFGQQHVVDRGRSLVVEIAERLVQVVEEVGAGGNQAVDQPVLDHAHHQPPHSGRNHGARHSHHDGAAVAEHLFPDFESQSELLALEGGALHARQYFGSAGGAHRIERAAWAWSRMRSLVASDSFGRAGVWV